MHALRRRVRVDRRDRRDYRAGPVNPCSHPESRASILFPARDYITGDRFEVASCGVCGLAPTEPPPHETPHADYNPTSNNNAPPPRRYPARGS